MPQIESPFNEPPRKVSFGERQEQLNTFLRMGARFLLGVDLTEDEETALNILVKLLKRSGKLEKWFKTDD
jgi:hypothetical protein